MKNHTLQDARFYEGVITFIFPSHVTFSAL